MVFIKFRNPFSSSTEKVCFVITDVLIGRQTPKALDFGGRPHCITMNRKIIMIIVIIMIIMIIIIIIIILMISRF